MAPRSRVSPHRRVLGLEDFGNKGLEMLEPFGLQ